MPKRFKLPKDFIEFFACLEKESCEYVIVGAYAMAVWGYVRATGDIDVFVNPTQANAMRVFRAIQRFGAPVSNLSASDLEKPGTVFQIGLPPIRIDILNSLDNLSFREAAKGAVKTSVLGTKLPILSLEGLIRNKRSTGRLKDQADAEELGKLKRERRKT